MHDPNPHATCYSSSVSILGYRNTSLWRLTYTLLLNIYLPAITFHHQIKSIQIISYHIFVHGFISPSTVGQSPPLHVSLTLFSPQSSHGVPSLSPIEATAVAVASVPIPFAISGNSLACMYSKSSENDPQIFLLLVHQESAHTCDVMWSIVFHFSQPASKDSASFMCLIL